MTLLSLIFLGVRRLAYRRKRIYLRWFSWRLGSCTAYDHNSVGSTFIEDYFIAIVFGSHQSTAHQRLCFFNWDSIEC